MRKGDNFIILLLYFFLQYKSFKYLKKEIKGGEKFQDIQGIGYFFMKGLGKDCF